MSILPMENHVAVVIGGTSGLGLSGALACIRAGARVVAVGRNPEQVIAAQTTLGDQAMVITGDATDPTTAEKAIDLAQQRWGRFDSLYHVAGGSGRKFGDGPLHSVTDEGIEKTLAMNLAAVIASNRAAVKAFLAQESPGSVLNMGSVLGHSPSPRHFATHVYAAAKAGIEGLTLAAASAYADRSIRFNVICPALVETPMAQRATKNDEILDFIRTKQPLDGGRVTQPQDLDAAVVFLLSSQSQLVTGQVMNVDGGWCVSEGQWE